MKEDSSSSFLSSMLYGLISLKEPVSFLTFLSVFFSIFILGFSVIVNMLGLGKFPNQAVFTPTLFSIVAGEAAFVFSIVLIIFSICMLFCYKLYYVISDNLKISMLFRQSLVKFPKFFIVTFVQSIISFLGIIAFVVPGVYYGSSFMFSNFFVLKGRTSVQSAFADSRNLAKAARFQAIASFVSYLLMLFLFLYVIGSLSLNEAYRALSGAALISYWIVACSNTLFSIADKNQNSYAGKSFFQSAVDKQFSKKY